MHTEEAKKRIGDTSRERWSDPLYRASTMASMRKNKVEELPKVLKAPKQPLTKNCQCCGSIFRTYPCSNRKFCSYVCKVIAQTGKPQTRVKKRYTRSCAVCNKDFFIGPSTPDKRKYCSVRCCRSDPEWIARMANTRRGQGQTLESRLKISEALKTIYSDPDMTRLLVLRARKNIKPNRLETNFYNLLDQMYPGQFQYTGDGSLIVGGKCPDFAHRSEKFLIEVYGDYWHRGDNPQDRIGFFALHGYRTVVLWENEINSILRSGCASACPIFLAAVAA